MRPSGLLPALLILGVIGSTYAVERPLRRVSDGAHRSDPPVLNIVAQANEDYDTLRYEAADCPYFWPIPNGADDRLLNVRFTPNYAPFHLMEAHIPLFDVFGEQGTPGMKVIVYQSGELDGESGYPVEAIDSVAIPFDSLRFGSENPIINIVNLRQLGISFNDEIDFHIAVDLIADANTDTLAIYFDEGRQNSTRSGIWDGEISRWNKLDEVNGIERPYNFFIHAVVSPNAEAVVGDVLRPAPLPNRVQLAAPYPNPFNQSAVIQYRVSVGVPYTLELTNTVGQVVTNLSGGVGAGVAQITLNAQGLPAGRYFIQLNTDEHRLTRPITFIK